MVIKYSYVEREMEQASRRKARSLVKKEQLVMPTSYLDQVECHALSVEGRSDSRTRR